MTSPDHLSDDYLDWVRELQASRPSEPVARVVDQLDHIQHRVVQEALSTAEASQWRERARMFRWAAPRPDDFHGQATPEQIRARWERCHAIADACDLRAEVCTVESWHGDVAGVLADPLGGAA